MLLDVVSLILGLPCRLALFCFFFFNDTATTEIYTLSLHDALPISYRRRPRCGRQHRDGARGHDHGLEPGSRGAGGRLQLRSEEHTSELQSRSDLVCRLLLEKKKKKKCIIMAHILHVSTRAPRAGGS